jgi:hypothetical protein
MPGAVGVNTEVTRSAELCWGQRYHWLRYHQMPERARHDAHIVTNNPLPDGLTLTQLRAALDYLVRRHEALRTVYDAGARPWPRQLVQPPAPLPLVVVATEPGPGPGPAEVIGELSSAPFDQGGEWPIRACAVTTGGTPGRLVLVLNHIAFDDWSLSSFKQEFETLLAALATRRPASLPPVLHQPADLAAIEAARPAAEARARVERRRAEIARLPADMFARRRRPGTTADAHNVSFTSPSLLTAVRDIAARHHVWPSSVHLAAYALTMAACTGEGLVGYRWLTSHRQEGPRMAVMSCMFSPALVSVELGPELRFNDVVELVAARAEEAQAHAYGPWDETLELLAEEGERRGRPIRVASEVNFLSNADRSCGSRRDRYVRHADPQAWAQSSTDTYLRIHEWRDGVTLGLNALPEVMDAEDAELFLRGFARLLEAHRDPAVNLRVDQAAELIGFAPPAGRRIVRVGPDPVDLDATEALLLAHPAVGSARLTVTDGLLVADVAADLPVTAAELRRQVLGGGQESPVSRCPDLFRISTGTGTGGEVGDGRDGPAHPPVTAAERALAAAIAAAHPELPEPDLTAGFHAAGGRVLRIPQVLCELRELGWTGVRSGQLTGPQPLLAVAAGLRSLG